MNKQIGQEVDFKPKNIMDFKSYHLLKLYFTSLFIKGCVTPRGIDTASVVFEKVTAEIIRGGEFQLAADHRTRINHTQIAHALVEVLRLEMVVGEVVLETTIRCITFATRWKWAVCYPGDHGWALAL